MEDKKEHINEEIWFSSVSKEELNKYDVEVAFAAFQQRVKDSRQDKASFLHRRLWHIAAAIAALIVVGFFSFKSGENNIETDMGNIVVEAPQGCRTQITLPDGTIVWLNAGTKISYSQGFSLVNRNVSLVGEGYFEVAHNDRLPFSVMSDEVQVNVLGTKFNFRDYPMDTEATVSLSEGSVSMCTKKDSFKEQILKPGERAIVDKRTGKIHVEEYEVSNSRQWISGKLIFDGEPLHEIVKTLERSYNVKIIIKGEHLKKLCFYGDFLRQEQSLGEVLEALAATGKLHYKREAQYFILY